jgi:hypothetical protein
MIRTAPAGALAQKPLMPRASVTPSAPLSPIFRLRYLLPPRFAPVSDGEVATYIPELARANPDWFGIRVATATGGIYGFDE